jgi:hypothetical protein
MRFSNEFKARQFFIDRVSRQAEKNGVSLTDAEKNMLTRTGTENKSPIDKNITNQFHAETTYGEFEQKVASLLKKAYEAEVNGDDGKKEVYRNAYKALRQGDHYIQMMIDDSIGAKLKKVRVF